jgi:cytochrome c553
MPVMKLRRLALALSLGLIALAGVAFVAARIVAPPELQWRLRVVEAKVRGDLGEIPLRNLIAWLAPGSPVYLAEVAENPNLHLSIKNLLTRSEDAAQGKLLYLRQCGQCHGEGGHGNSGPNLLGPVSNKSD